MKHKVKREKLKVPMIILAALAAVFIMMLPSPVMAFYAEAIPDDVAPAGFSLSSSEDYDYSKKAGCFLEMGRKKFTYKGENRAPAGEWTYQYWDEVDIYIGETDDVNGAMNFIQNNGDKGWGWYSAKKLKERIPSRLGSERSHPGIKFWEEELFGNNQWHYACECIYHPRNDKLDRVGRGVSTSLWFSGNKFIIVETSSAYSQNKVHDSFREDVFYPTMEEARKITVPSKPSLTEKPAETTPSPTPSSSAPTTPLDDMSDGTVEIHINNEYNNEQTVYFYIYTSVLGLKDEDDYDAVRDVPSGASDYYFGDCDLFPGHYRFEIEWTDPDSGDRCTDTVYEYIKAGETTKVTLTTKKCGSTTTTTPTPTATPTTGTAKIYMINEYHQVVDTILYIDGEYKDVEYVPPDAWKYHHGDYELSDGTHTFRISWVDLSDYKAREYEISGYIRAGGTAPITLTVGNGESAPTPEPTPTATPSTGTVEVYVNNECDEEIYIYLDIDNYYYTCTELVPSGSSNYHFGNYELSEDVHVFKIEWIDYESGEDDEAETTEYISAGEKTKVTLTAEKREVVVPTPVPTDIATFMDILPDNPSAMKGIVAAGVPPQNARNYESSGKYLSLNDYVPQTPADTWEDVARYEFLKGKMHSKEAQVEGNFNIVYKALSWISKAISLKADVKDTGTQYKTLDSISLSKLTSNPKLIADFANNMANIYAETSKTDSEVMRFIGSLSSAYTSEGLSAYTHVSNFIMSELKQSEHYDMEQATLGYSKAYHAMRMHEIATKKEVTEEEVKEYFRHVKAFLLLKKTEARVDYRETYATWGGTGVFSRSSIAIITDALGITTGESRLEGLENYNVVCVKWLERLDTNIEYMDSLERELLGVGA